jgi:hypothetical protein
MRRFMVHFVTEIDFVDGDEASDDMVQNYQKHLKETVQSAAQGLSLRTIKGAQVESVTVPKAGQRLRCSRCGGKRVLTRPAWHTAQRQAAPDYAQKTRRKVSAAFSLWLHLSPKVDEPWFGPHRAGDRRPDRPQPCVSDSDVGLPQLPPADGHGLPPHEELGRGLR